MPTGPNGEKRPTDVITNAVHVMRVATGEIEEEHVNAGQRKGGQKGGKARKAALSKAKRTGIAKKAATRWSA